MSNISFEKSLSQLEDIVNQLEKGDLTLEQSVKLYEKGLNISVSCKKKLETAKLKIEEISHKIGDENV